MCGGYKKRPEGRLILSDSKEIYSTNIDQLIFVTAQLRNSFFVFSSACSNQ